MWIDADELKKSRTLVISGSGSILAKNFFRPFGSQVLGEISPGESWGPAAEGIFAEFLNKFGRKLFLDRALGWLFNDAYPSWEINSLLFYAGWRIFEQDQKKFEEMVRKARNDKEFLQLTGIK